MINRLFLTALLLLSLTVLTGQGPGTTHLQDHHRVAPAPPVSGSLPCDILANAGTPCVAAYSVVRTLLASYNGPLFQLQRASDSNTYNIGTVNGVADMTAIATFCAGTTCTFQTLYDQMQNGNDLPVRVNPAPYGTDMFPHGTTLPILVTVIGQSYDNRANTSRIPTGNSSIGVYEVGAQRPNVSGFGEAENRIIDDNTSMFSVAATTRSVCLDHENGAFCAHFTPGTVPQRPTVLAHRDKTTNLTVIKYGDATTGTLITAYNDARAHIWKFEGGLALGDGGDGYPEPGGFFEGAVIGAASTDAIDNLVQANIVSFYGAL
jgi:non-reducing end alpha-L-arabinofuranosidase